MANLRTYVANLVRTWLTYVRTWLTCIRTYMANLRAYVSLLLIACTNFSSFFSTATKSLKLDHTINTLLSKLDHTFNTLLSKLDHTINTLLSSQRANCAGKNTRYVHTKLILFENADTKLIVGFNELAKLECKTVY